MFDRTSMSNRRPLRLRYAFDPIMGVEIPSTDPVAVPPVVPPTDLGFPADTKPADMTDAEQVAYWKHHSRRHEATADSRKDYDALKAKAAKADALEAANATENDKAIAAALAQGKAEGANTYLEAAVRGELRTLTGKTVEELSVALELIDVTKLALADGGLDMARIEAFAKTLGNAAPAEPGVPSTNPVKDVFDRISTTPPAGAPSIAAAAKARAAELSTSNN